MYRVSHNTVGGGLTQDNGLLTTITGHF